MIDTGVEDLIDYKRHSLEPTLIYDQKKIKPYPDLQDVTFAI